MGFSSLFIGIVTGGVLFLALPYVLIEANSLFNLPVITNYIFQAVGVFLMIVGALVFAYCSGLFIFVGKGTPLPTDPPHELVTGGIYKFSRNPMYLSYLGIFLGEFLFLGHITLLLYFFIMSIFIPYFVVRIEEPDLTKRFGKKYIEYKKTTPRWL